MAERFVIKSGGIFGRERESRFFLDHPHVSLRHASLVVLSGGRPTLSDLGSGTGTFVNGKRIFRPVELKDGDVIQIGPYSLRKDGSELTSQSRSNNLELSVRNVRRVVAHPKTGKEIVLLDDVSLVARPREFTCILGPSGAGKSTLIGMLSGRVRPESGAVAINNQDLYSHFASLKQDIAVVAQRDAMHEGLTIGQSLRFTAELRLPPDTRREEVSQCVDETLQIVGMLDHKDTLLRTLSGGQLKRAGLANELISRPSLLLIDEATTGLDEQTDRDMMELFRRIADTGKTVVCITHNLSNVEPVCNMLVLLTQGGKLAFIGTPAEAKTYFGVNRLGDIFRKLVLFPPEQWQSAYKTSPLYKRYVEGRVPRGVNLNPTVRKDPSDEEDDEEDVADPPLIPQTMTLIRRSLALWTADRLALGAMFGQSLVLAIFLIILFGNVAAISGPASAPVPNPNFEINFDLDAAAQAEWLAAIQPLRILEARQTVNLLFILNVSCFWFGCNNAVKEIVKERVIFARERAFNLRIDAYYASKFLVLAMFAVAQATIFFGLVRLFCGPEGSPAGQWLVFALLAIAGTALGLFISSLARSEEMAIALVPLCVVPQIIFAGVITPTYGPAHIIARAVIASTWAQSALESLVPDQLLQEVWPDYAPSYYEALMILVHAAVFAGLTLAVLNWRDRRKGQ